jgi:hypothetical protein
MGKQRLPVLLVAATLIAVLSCGNPHAASKEAAQHL